jgi:hypothetical protein
MIFFLSAIKREEMVREMEGGREGGGGAGGTQLGRQQKRVRESY